MPSNSPSFESMQKQQKQQNTQWERVRDALASFHPSDLLAVSPEILRAFEGACSATSHATTPIPFPMGVRV